MEAWIIPGIALLLSALTAVYTGLGLRTTAHYNDVSILATRLDNAEKALVDCQTARWALAAEIIEIKKRLLRYENGNHRKDDVHDSHS